MPAKDIRDAIKEKRLLIGSREVLRSLRKGRIESVFFATNCPEQSRNQLMHYSGISGVRMEKFEGNSRQLGEICGRPYKTTMVGIIK